jgi:hypothetical protein
MPLKLISSIGKKAVTRNRHLKNELGTAVDGAPGGVVGAAVEMLEGRLLMSLTVSNIEGPVTRPGTTWNYQTLDSTGAPNGDTETITVGQLTTYNGYPAYQENVTSFIGGVTGTQQDYFNIVNGTYVDYGIEVTDDGNGGHGSAVNNPPDVLFPKVLNAGQPYTSNYDFVETYTNSDGKTTDSTVGFSDTYTLVSDQPTKITVPKGTFNAYEIDNTGTTTTTDSTTGMMTTNTDDPTTDYVVPGIGDIESINGTGTSQTKDVLVSFNAANERLGFGQGPTDAQTGNAIKPPITVKIFNAQGALDSTGGDSTDAVTLAITGGSAALGGTVTVSAVGGIATFDNISVPTAGTYTITASVDSSVTPITSSTFTVSQAPPSSVTPVLSRLKVPVSAVSGTTVNGSASVTVTNNTQSTVSGNQTETTYLSTIPTLDTSAIQVGKPVTKSVNLKPGKSAVITVPIKTLPQVSAAGNYYLLFQTTDSSGASSVVASSSTIAVGPASVSLAPVVTAVKLAAAVVSGSASKGSVSLAITNNGNVVSKGTTVIDITASTVSGVVGTSIAMLSKSLAIPAGKTVKVTVPIKSIPVLADGNYFIVAQVTDPFTANVTTASSAATTSIAAPFIAIGAVLGPVTKIKAGDTLTITNNGNIDDVSSFTTTLGFSLDAAGTQPVGATTTVASHKLTIKATKTGKIHLTGWSSILSGLVAGVPYYLTVSVVDATGHSSTAVSTTSFTL